MAAVNYFFDIKTYNSPIPKKQIFFHPEDQL